MKTVAQMREYVIAYVKSQALIFTGQEILHKHFGIPFSVSKGVYFVNNVPMDDDEFAAYLINFFEEMDTIAIIELYNKIKV